MPSLDATLLLDTNILIDVLRGEAVALSWLERQQRPALSVISWIEVLVGCRDGEADLVEPWLESFPRLPLDQAVAREAVALRQSHGLTLATRNVRDFPLTLGSVLHPYGL